MEKIRNAFSIKTTSFIGAIGAVSMLILYVCVYMKYAHMTTELEVANVQLKNSLIELRDYYNNMEKYQQESKKLEEEIKEIMDKYPVDAREEDVVMLAVNTQEKNLLNYDSINMMDPTVVYIVPQDVVLATGLEGFNQEIIFMEKQASYTNETDYTNMKGIVKQVTEMKKRVAINHIQYAIKEDTGMLEGTLDLSFYIAKGTGKEYIYPDIAEYISGTKDPFNE